jgi:hypothetical protein
MRMKSHKNQKNKKPMGKKPTNVGKELVQRTRDLNRNIETIMGKTVKPKETFNIIGDGVTLTLSDNIRFDLNDNYLNMNFIMDLDRETLKGMADFIYKYLENN